ncbi:hypothetical protein SS50377_25675 [Spironucleus salmonicida]|uniref:Uncharacterized protein n=1 Tax=Spironucleus salmonicida TaxID=348837 RepID=V6LPN0_9EUKA|nr:hypothetical protein SS50377_25675 [Spironucleus salmonicida]|eukprot:EST42689.1 Hypothetical protein SS50377_17710 [Spironucleus salmonicida]
MKLSKTGNIKATFSPTPYTLSLQFQDDKLLVRSKSQQNFRKKIIIEKMDLRYSVDPLPRILLQPLGKVIIPIPFDFLDNEPHLQIFQSQNLQQE